MTASNKTIHGAPISDYLGVWRVDEIFEGSTGIKGDWATIGRHIALYKRNDGVVLGFVEDGFCLENYEPLWFKQCNKSQYLIALGRDGIMQMTVGFADKANKEIVFNFTHANGDSFCQSGGWSGSVGG